MPDPLGETMQLARVIGTIVATRKYEGLEGSTILMIQPLTDDLKPSGKPIAAIDAAQAGTNDLVHWISAREATLVLPKTFVPVDAAITGIVDDVNQQDVGILDKEEIFI